MTELALLKAVDDLGALYAEPESLDKVLDGIEAAVRAHDPDVSTAKGRGEIRSLAYDVTRSKTALDAAGKALTEGWRARTNAVNAERKRIATRLDTLAEEVRRPLTDWEEAEERRKSRISSEIASAHPQIGAAATSAEIADEIARIEGIDTAGWDEFREDGVAHVQATLAGLRDRHAGRLEFEAVAAENARLAAEARERERAAAEERAKREAEAREAEQAKARAEAEARAEQARKDREAAEAIAAAERRAQEAEAVIAAERAAIERANREKEEAVARAEAEAEAQAERARRRDEITSEIASALLALIDGKPANEAADACAKALVAGKIPWVGAVI